MEWISLLGIIAAIVLFAVLCFKGIPVTVSAPVLSIMLWLFSAAAGDGLSFDGAVRIFSSGAASAIERYLLLFMFSASFGGLLCEVGIASAIGAFFSGLIMRAPKRWQKLLAVAVVPLINAILTYSGVSLFVVVFAVVAIARDLFRRMDVPWHLYSMSMIGSATFTSGLLPGSPSLSNLVPMEYLGTTSLAAPVLSLILSAVSLALGAGYMAFALWRTERAGEGFLPTGEGISQVEFRTQAGERKICVPLAFLPMLSPVIFINAAGLSVELSLLLSNLLILILYRKHLNLERVKNGLVSGLTAGISPAISLGVMMGFGSMLTSSSGFRPILRLVYGVPGPMVLKAIVMVSVTSFLLGNANAGITTSLEAMGPDALLLSGVSPEVLHRAVSMASLFGASPHSSALCNSLLVAKLNHRVSYRHYFVIGIVNTAILSAVAVVLIQVGITY